LNDTLLITNELVSEDPLNDIVSIQILVSNEDDGKNLKLNLIITGVEEPVTFRHRLCMIEIPELKCNSFLINLIC
jgi:hypothetical protein